MHEMSVRHRGESKGLRAARQARRGATAMSYALLLGLVGIGGLAAVTRVGSSVDDLFATTASTLSGTADTDGGSSSQGDEGGGCVPGSLAFATPTSSGTFDVDQQMDIRCTQLSVHAWGAAGGGGNSGPGGAGGFVSAILVLDLAASYTVYVGRGGARHDDSSSFAGAGGTASAVQLGGTELVVAGGGGGAGTSGAGGNGGGNGTGTGVLVGQTAPDGGGGAPSMLSLSGWPCERLGP